ncbi:hypothetical protein EYC80_008875 [Monilinia laxa]|uniref:Uncharacterized protein n=1 Tax=Monilinia laxa TaxID=61186 RepID=A0A5N6K252_MONLA|nr:hypothetical protein EYC80_008875 [Monilinia laxa]
MGKAQDTNMPTKNGDGRTKGKGKDSVVVKKDPSLESLNAIKLRLSSLRSTNHNSSPVIAKTICLKVGNETKDKQPQASKQKHGGGELKKKSSPIAISPNNKSMSPQEKNKDITPSSMFAVKAMSQPKRGKGKGSRSENTTIPITIQSPPTTKSIPVPISHKTNKNQRSMSQPLITPSSPKESFQSLSKSAPNSPSQPRKDPTLSTAPGTSLISVAPKLSKRFYEALVLLTVFGKNRGEHTREEEFQSDHDEDELLDPDPKCESLGPISQNTNRMKLRRSFTRHLAYLCDFEKGGASTTAIALQRTDMGEVVYHVASNKCPQPDRIKEFLGKVLRLLESVSMAGKHGEGERDRKNIEEMVFLLSIKHAEKRISCYSKFLVDNIDFVLKKWSVESGDVKIDSSLPQLGPLLHRLLDLSKNPFQLCRFCYETTTSKEFANLTHLIKSNSRFSTRLANIRHTIGRLNHTTKATKILISASSLLPFLFTKITISRTPSAPGHPPPLQERDPHLSDIIGRMMGDPTSINSYRAALEEMDHKYQLSQNLHSHCQDKNWKPKIHAELLLLQHFYTHKLAFLDDDRYIACSKPACYCCYNYIKRHPGNFVVPGSHHNNYLNWRAPDVQSGDQDGERVRRDILIGMSQVFRGEVLGQILEMRGPRGGKPDSMTEVSSVRFAGAELDICRRVGLHGYLHDTVNHAENEMSGEEEHYLEGDCDSLAGDHNSEEEEQDWTKASEVDENDSPQSIEITETTGHDLGREENNIEDSDDEDESEDEGGVSL